MIEMKFATNPPIKTTYDTKVEFKSGGGEVISVNGKKGKVILTAEDVGAATKEYVDDLFNSLVVVDEVNY